MKRYAILSFVLFSSLVYGEEGIGFRVQAQQTMQSGYSVCQYEVTNISSTPLNSFMVGGARNAFELTQLPVHWQLDKDGNPEPVGPDESPSGWDDMILTQQAAHPRFIVQWRSKDPQADIKPGSRLTFQMRFPKKGPKPKCTQWTSNAAFREPQMPSVTPSTASLAMTWSHFRVLSNTAMEADVKIQNLGSEGAILNLGLAKGDKNYPVAFVLVARNAKGTVQKLLHSMPVTMPGSGFDRLVVPLLPANPSYTVRAKWETFSPLPSGPYEFNVEFVGTQIQTKTLKATVP